MKRNVLVMVAAALIVCCLVGCGSPKEVPEQTLVREIEDYIKGADLGDFEEYVQNINHNYDKSTKTDAVTINLTVTYLNSVAEASYNAIYQYDKTSDLWNKIRGDGWSSMRSRSINLSSSVDDWLEAFQKESFDFYEQKDSKESLADALLTYDVTIKDGWMIGYSGDGLSFAEIDTYGNEISANAARAFYDFRKNSIEENEDYTITWSSEGDNYQAFIFEIAQNDKSDNILKYLNVQADQYYLIFYLNEKLTSQKINDVLKHLGVAPIIFE